MTTSRARLFIAVSVPEGPLRTVEHAVEPLRRELPDARWAAIASQHITLKFLGWTEESRVEEVRTAMASVAAQHESADVSMRDVGAFPNQRRARVVWAGIEDASRLLSSLAHALEAAVEPLGFERERRPFTPHLTLARIKNPTRVNLEPISVVSDPWRVSTVELFRSHVSPRGARYEVLSSETLGDEKKEK